MEIKQLFRPPPQGGTEERRICASVVDEMVRRRKVFVEHVGRAPKRVNACPLRIEMVWLRQRGSWRSP